MRRARRERAKERVKERARARRVIDRDLLVRLGQQQKRRKSRVDFTLDQERHVLRVETASTVTQRIHQGLTAPAGGRRSICYPYLQGKCTKGKRLQICP